MQYSPEYTNSTCSPVYPPPQKKKNKQKPQCTPYCQIQTEIEESGENHFRYDLNQIPYDYTVQVRNRFNRLDMIDRMPNELWMEVRDIVQETGIKTISKKKNCKKAKWLSEEALQIAVK